MKTDLFHVNNTKWQKNWIWFQTLTHFEISRKFLGAISLFRKIITKLKKQNIKVFIITASEENLLLKQLDYFNIKDLFDGYVASKDIKANSKVENAKDFIKENNLNPRKSIMFGDTVHDALVAKEIGIKCVLFSKGHNTKKKLKDTGLLAVNSYKAFYKYIEKNI